MTYLKFYADENERHPIANAVHWNPERIEAIVKKLTRHYFGNFDASAAACTPSGSPERKARPVHVEFRNRSHGTAWGSSTIWFPTKGCSALLVAHEFAHIYEMRKYGNTGHRARMARVVDRVVAYMGRKGWLQESPSTLAGAKVGDHGQVIVTDRGNGQYAIDTETVRAAAGPGRAPEEVTPEQIADVEYDMNQAAKIADLNYRIAKRVAQVKRLERKKKALATRAKKATRSLDALRRSLARLTNPS